MVNDNSQMLLTVLAAATGDCRLSADVASSVGGGSGKR